MSNQTTNDEQASYGEQPKREPMLSDEQCDEWDQCDCRGSHGSEKVRDFYEAKITSGELIVAKTAGIDADGNCTECGWDADHRYPFSTYCPGCGAEIIEG